jgi:hypothetical protein
MAHNPSYVGKTHVVTHHDAQGGNRGSEELHEVLGVHDNYGAARNTIDQHLGTKAKRTKMGSEHIYHDPKLSDDDLGDPVSYAQYRIHREDSPGKFTKV